MGGKDRERRLARQRYERKLARRARARRRARTYGGLACVVLLAAGGLVLLALALGWI